MFVDVALSGPDVVLEDVYATFPPTKYPWWGEDPIIGNPNNCTENNTMNWIETTAYDRDGDVIASAKAYSNYLGKPLQTQQKNLTENQVMASQPIYDKYGRPVIQTLSAPVDQTQFCYKEDFVTNQYGEVYDYEDFDIPNNTNSENYIASGEVDKPKAVGSAQEGTLGWYYSDNNTLESYVATTSYPYSRVEYDVNNPGKQKRAASPGNHHRMGKGHESESYTMLEAGELMYVYGPLQSWIESDEKPGYQIIKTINIDPDGKQVVSFSDLDGKLIATCMAGQVDNQNQNTLAVSSYIGELGYVDVHLPKGCENSLELFNDGTVVYKILNLQTNKYVSFSGVQEYTGTSPGIEPGFYRIIETSGYSTNGNVDIEVNYNLNYYEFALNYYDKAGRLVRTVPPLGIEKVFLEYGFDLPTTVDQFSEPFYCEGLLETPCDVSYEVDNMEAVQMDYMLSEPTFDQVYTDVIVKFKQIGLNDDGGVTVFDIPLEMREAYMLEQESSIRPVFRQQVTVVSNKSNRIQRASRYVKNKKVLQKGSSYAYSTSLNNSLPTSLQSLGPEPGNGTLDNTCYNYHINFNVFSGLSSGDSPDVINQGTISLMRCSNDDFQTESVEPYDEQGVISGAIRALTNEVSIELLSLEKRIWHIYEPLEDQQNGNVAITVAELTQDDFDFLSGYEIELEAVNYESNTINHHMEDVYEYNSLGWLLSSTTPDGGLTEYNYRKDGSLRFSQNAKQKESLDFSYTNYDNIGRVIEVGEYKAFGSGNPLVSHMAHGNTYYASSNSEIPLVHFIAHGQPSFTANIEGATNTLMLLNQEDGLDDSYCHQNTFYSYDKPDLAFEEETGLSEVDYRQRFVRGKLSKSWTDKPHTNTTWYSYDEQGRTTWMVQKVEGLGVKTVDYLYDEKGNVHQVIYQKDNSLEAFYHKYQYDADNRLLKVETSTDATNWQKEAEYQYYLHGPLKRVELAEDLQGIDYLYTVQGQLKSINSPNIGATATNLFTDPGEDGQNEFATDVFGMSIDYYSGDYVRAGTHVNYTTPNQSSFAGNISSVRWNTQGMSLANIGKQNIYKYDYEHHNWLSGATFGSYHPNSCQNAEPGAVYCSMLDEYQTVEKGDVIGPNTFSFSFNTMPNSNEDYKVSNITYDANGNLLSLHRNGYTDASNNLTNVMDVMDYHYLEDEDGNRVDNKLTHISDVLHDNEGLGDIASQENDNYVYNEIGQLVYNDQEGHYYTYDAYGLLTGVYKDASHTEPVAEYFYDDKGFRSKKVLYDTDNANLQTHATWYIRDASGNLLSLYEQDLTQESALSTQTEVPIYGASRIGQYQADNNGQKTYELTDHLGTVRAVIEREKDENNQAQTLVVSDYYPFGMPMPGRQEYEESYRYGYQGQYAEKDGETSFNSFELRQWDARIARWNSMDPYGQYFSSYMGMGNNPVSLVDPNGGFSGDPDPPISHTMLDEITLTAEGTGNVFGSGFGNMAIQLTSISYDYQMPDIIRDWDGIYRRGQGEYFDNGIGFRYDLQDGVGIRSSAQVNGRFSISDDGEVSVYAQVFHAEKNINYEYKGVVRFRVYGKETMVRLNVNPELDNIYRSIYKPIGYARYNIPRTGVVDMEIYIGYEVNTGAGYFNGEYFNQSYKLSW